MTSKVKGQGHKVTWYVWHVLANKLRMKSLGNIEIGTMDAYPLAIMRTSFKAKRSKVKVTRQINALVTNATWLMWNRLTDGTAVGEIPCPQHSLFDNFSLISHDPYNEQMLHVSHSAQIQG